jgi:hypothetical protein
MPLHQPTLAAVAAAGVIALATLPRVPAEAAPEHPNPGIRCYGGEKIAYERGGERLHVTFGKPVVVAVAEAPLGWGYFQFPTIARAEDGAIRVDWHMAPDSAAGYGTEGGCAVSRDGGRTWTPAPDAAPATGLALPNGDHIENTWPKAVPVSSLDLPASVGVIRQTYGGVEQTMYRLSELPESVRGVPLRRRAKGATAWNDEWAALDDADALRYAIQGLFPVLWLGDMKVLRDGSLLAGVYPGYRLREDGSMDPKGGAFFYRSTDDGHHWTARGRIPYQPDTTVDPMGADRAGFTEPATERLADGSLLCVMRTTDGLGVGPMYASRSTDGGRAWSRPEAFTENGVLPRLLQLENGVLVLSAGRPGVQLRFSTDGHGARWTEPFEMLPWAGGNWDGTCGYTGLLATGPDRFLITYSDFHYPTKAGRRKAIMVREVRMERDGG